MSYTLKGRCDSRLCAMALPLLAACVLAAVLPAFWPIELVGLMLVVGLVLDAVLYSAIDYQPGWYALPFGLLELALTMGLVRALDIAVPLWPALAFYAGAWLVAQALAFAGFPLLAVSYAEDGGELGRLGAVTGAVTLAVLAASGGIAYAKQPPTVYLSAGVHQGPLVITRREILVGRRGAVVRGGIVIRASNVTVRNVAVVGGENGIDIENARGVMLDGVSIVGATMDGIHARRAQLMIHNCSIVSPGGYTQGIDISFAVDKGMSMVDGCTVTGGREGIVTHSAQVDLENNRVTATTMRGIAMTEMSMGMIGHNLVTGGVGIGIFCGDRSECMVERNHVAGTRADTRSSDLGQLGYGIESNFEAVAQLSKNELYGNAHAVGSIAGGKITHR